MSLRTIIEHKKEFGSVLADGKKKIWVGGRLVQPERGARDRGRTLCPDEMEKTRPGGGGVSKPEGTKERSTTRFRRRRKKRPYLKKVLDDGRVRIGGIPEGVTRMGQIDPVLCRKGEN